MQHMLRPLGLLVIARFGTRVPLVEDVELSKFSPIRVCARDILNTSVHKDRISILYTQFCVLLLQ
jgi:hypothetical protein